MRARHWVQVLTVVRGGEGLGRCMGLGSAAEGCDEVSNSDNDSRHAKRGRTEMALGTVMLAQNQ